TQQLIKNNVFTGWMGERSFPEKVVRKLQEQALAIQLEGKVSKEWILENYLNTINLGSGCWGVQSASRKYFGEDVSGLSLAESAMLAGITKNPSGYSPLQHPEAGRKRQMVVLGKMRELGYITDAEYEEALAEPVLERIARIRDSGQEARVFSWYEDALLNQICDDLKKEYGYTENEAWRLLYRGGLTVEAAQDSTLQAITEEEINKEENYDSDAQASLVIIDYRTGEVKAIVGGRGEKTASLVLNRATDSVRQPGSTLKVVGEYAAVLEKGGTLGDIYDDAPCVYSDGSAIRNVSGTFGGRMTMRQAIADSVNVAAVKAFRQAGADTVYDILKEFGFEKLTEEDLVESLALGGTHGGVTNLELTAAYGTLADRGRYCKPTFYSRVLGRDGSVLLERKADPVQVVDAQTADLLTSAMESVLTDGTGREAAFAGMSLAGKSGTTTDRRDVWFVGYTPYYVCGVWGGYDDNRAQNSSNYVKRIWKRVMYRSHERLGNIGFAGVNRLSRCEICGKCGKRAVEGLCDHTLQGDMSYEETYIPGTEPKEFCDCHEQVQVCTVSGKKAGIFCPMTGVQWQTYLKAGTAGTADEAAVIPEGLMESSCTVHGKWWNGLFGWVR
ncbi:MAG TPA: glycosyl transferase, partial [Lachnospiraceae bacterium]|nr:glycosyl transferase [Lachnospiraceae bacterium]